MKASATRLTLAIGLALAWGARAADTLTAPLLASNETPGLHVGDRAGAATFAVDGTRVLFGLLMGIADRPTSVHIRSGAAGRPGGISIDFPTDAATGVAARVAVTSKEVAADLVRNPQDYYVVVNTARFPDGAYRGRFDPAATNTLPPDALLGPLTGRPPQAAGSVGGPMAPGAAGRPALAAAFGAGPPGPSIAVGAALRPPQDSPLPPAAIEPPRPGTAGQTIRFAPPSPAFYGDPDFELFATASSRLPVRFTASGDCTVSGATVHIVSAGKCFLTAHQPGDSSFAAAPDVDQRLSIEKASQTVDFPPPPDKVYLDGDFTPEATASSGLPITFQASGDCSMDSSRVHIEGAGTCALTAHQPGDANFTAARIVDQEFLIARADQTITFSIGYLGPIPSVGVIPLFAHASSGLPVSVTTWGSCQFTGSGLQIGPGTCMVTLEQPGDRNFNPAPPQTQFFEVPEP